MKIKALFISVLLTVLIATLACAGTVVNYPMFQSIDGDGNPRSGALLYSYIVGDAIPKALYTDKACATPATNPVVLDSNGEAEIYGLGCYKLVLKTSVGVTVWTMADFCGTNDQYVTYYYPDYSAANHGATGDSNTIKYAVDTIGTTNKATIFLRHNSGSEFTDYVFSTSDDYTSNTNITFIFEKGARLDPDAGKTVTLPSPDNVQASIDQQIKTGNGSLAFATAGDVPILWFGQNTIPGTTDMTAIAQAACTAAANGSTIKSPPADMLVSDTITIAKSLTIEGTGWVHRIIQGTADTETFQATSQTALHFKNLYLYGEGSFTTGVATNAKGISLVTCTKSTIDHCRFANHGYAAVYAIDTSDLQITDNLIEGTHAYSTPIASNENQQFGIVVYDGNDIEVSRNDVSGTTQGIASTFNTAAGHPDGMLIDHNTIHDIPGQHGMYLLGSNLSVSNNIITDPEYAGIKVVSSTEDLVNVSLSHNIVSSSTGGKNGAVEISGDGGTITGLTIDDLTCSGMSQAVSIVYNVADVHISNINGNDFESYGVRVSSTGNSDVTIMGVNLKDVGNTAIWLNNVSRGVLSGIKVYDFGTVAANASGILIQGTTSTSNVQLSDFQIINSTGTPDYGLYVAAGTGFRISNGYLTGAATYDVRLDVAMTSWHDVKYSSISGAKYLPAETRTDTITLSNADIKALVASPKELVAAQGAGTLIEFVSAVLFLNYSGGALAEPSNPDDLAIEYNDGTGTQIATWDTTNFITAAADMMEVVAPQSIAGVAAVTNVNKNIVLINTGTDYTGAASTSTMTVQITYRVHPTNL